MYRVQGNFIDRIYNTVIPFVANTAQPFQLALTSIVAELQFRLTGTLTNAGLTGSPVKRVESLENLISLLTITGNGKVTGAQADQFTAVDASYLAYKTRCMETTAPERVDVGVANAAYNFVSTFKKYFGPKRTGNSSFYQSCFLDARNLSAFTATVNWRDVAAVIDSTTLGGGTTTLSNVAITVLSREYQGGPSTINSPYVRESQRTFNIANSGLLTPFLNAPVGGWMPRQTFKATVGDVSYADPTDSMIVTTQRAEGAHIQTQQNGTYIWMDTGYTQQRAVDKTLYNLESLPSGYVTLEYPGGLNLATAATLQNNIDITYAGGSTNTLQITDEQVIFAKK